MTLREGDDMGMTPAEWLFAMTIAMSFLCMYLVWERL